MDSHYVQSANYSTNADCFISATSAGEVKLWRNDKDLQPLGTINSKDWVPTAFFSHLETSYLLNPHLARRMNSQNENDSSHTDVNSLSSPQRANIK